MYLFEYIFVSAFEAALKRKFVYNSKFVCLIKCQISINSTMVLFLFELDYTEVINDIKCNGDAEQYIQ